MKTKTYLLAVAMFIATFMLSSSSLYALNQGQTEVVGGGGTIDRITTFERTVNFNASHVTAATVRVKLLIKDLNNSSRWVLFQEIDLPPSTTSYTFKELMVDRNLTANSNYQIQSWLSEANGQARYTSGITISSTAAPNINSPVGSYGTPVMDHTFGTSGSIKNSTDLDNNYYWGMKWGTDQYHPKANDEEWQNYTAYTSNNYVFASDHLSIVARDISGSAAIVKDKLTSGCLRTKSAYIPTSTKSIYVETRIKLPKGKGLWPAFWFYPEAQPRNKAEIDIFEIVNKAGETTSSFEPLVYHGNLHANDNPPHKQFSSSHYVTTPLSSAYHTWGCEWTVDDVKFYIDGKLFRTTAYPVNDGPAGWGGASAANVIVNLAAGGEWPGDADDPAAYPASMDIEYIRVYEKGSGGGGTTTTKINSVSAPTSVSQGETVSFSIAYEADASKKIKCTFQQNVDPWDYYASDTKTVSAGTGSVQVSMVIPSSVAIGNGYQFQTTIGDDDTWGNKDHNMVKSPITVTDGDSPPPSTYTLTVNASNGSVSKSPDKSAYDDGETVTLTASANSGYKFDNWSGDASGTSTTATVTMNSNKTVTANFSEVSTGGSSFKYLKFTATAGSNIKINEVDWLVGSTSYPTTAMTSNNSGGVVASGDAGGLAFRAFDNDISDHIWVGNAIPYKVILELPNTINVTGLKYTKAQWSGLTGFTAHGSNDGVNWTLLHTETGIAASSTVTEVTFEGTTPPPSTYTLTVNATNGSVSKSPDKANYDDGESVSLTATANSGYQFDNWSGDASGTSTTATVTMNSNKTVTANFSAIPANTYSLTVNASNGSVSKSPDKANYDDGESVTLTATANSGYQFDNWSGDASGTSTSTTITMNSNKTVTANFSVVSSGGSSYKYLKFIAKSGSNIKINEIDWLVGSTSYPTAAMTSNNSAGAIASGDAGSLSYKVFNNDVSNHLWVGNTTPYEFVVNLGSAIDVTGVRVTRGEWSTLTSFEAHGSNDGTNWTLLHTETGLTQVGSDNAVEVTFSSTKSVESTLDLSGKESMQTEVSIYPNPSNGQFNISLSSEYKGDVSIQIFSFDGKIIETHNLQKQAIEFSYEFNIEDKTSGIYLIKVIAGDYQAQQKYIKQ